MIDLTIWSLLVDISLMGSLIYLAYRLTRAESVAVKIDKVGDLEKTLRRVISDAEESSIELDQKLRTRQRDLETLLDDLKSVEDRVNTSFKSSNEVKEGLERNIENCKNLIKKLATLANLANKDKRPSYSQLSDNNDYENDELILESRRNNQANRIIELDDNDMNNDNILISNYRSEKQRKINESQREDKALAKSEVEKQYIVKKPVTKKSALSSRIEKESYISKKELATNNITPKEIKQENIEVQTFKDENLEAIRTLKNRELARTLLKMGIPVNTISQKTNISVDEILEMKDETITNSEVNKMATSSDDARLGVLSKMRREIATL